MKREFWCWTHHWKEADAPLLGGKLLGSGAASGWRAEWVQGGEEPGWDCWSSSLLCCILNSTLAWYGISQICPGKIACTDLRSPIEGLGASLEETPVYLPVPFGYSGSLFGNAVAGGPQKFSWPLGLKYPAEYLCYFAEIPPFNLYILCLHFAIVIHRL